MNCTSLNKALAITAGFSFTMIKLFAHPHPLQASTDAVASSSATATAGPIISGQGQFRYQYEPDKMKLPVGVKVKHGHGLARDKAGNIYFNFEPESVDAATRGLVRFAPDGTDAVLLGEDNLLAQGVPHGLKMHVDKDGSEVLYHINNDGTVAKTKLDGKILWSQKWGPQMGNYKPTDAVCPPGSEWVIVSDGYGSSMLHCLKRADGIYAGKSWGGAGSAHGEFNCPHGITYDPRKELLLVSDRGNKRLEYYTTKGVYHSSVEIKESKAPCNVDIQGDYALVPDLDGPVIILDKENKTVSVIEVGKLLGAQGFVHPHQAIWLENGDIVVCTWNPGRIGYFRKL